MIGILTFYWADDYGAMLQSYALKTYLNGYQKAVLLPYFPKALRSRYRLLQINKNESLLRKLYYTVKQRELRSLYERLKTKYRMCRFRRKYLINEGRKLGTSEEIYRYNQDVDTYVVGSDQVWNPEITEGFQEGYFCTFRQWKGTGARYIAYAASIGTDRLKEEYSGAFSGLLSNFDSISLRESSAVSYIGALYGQKPETVLDPVFLLNRKEWQQMSRPGRKKKKGYIAVYDTEYNPEMAQYIRRLAARTGLRILILSCGKRKWTEDARHVMGCGPLEFIGLLAGADYVVTNSFHGAAMSIIFRKQFVAFAHSTRNARIIDLLAAAGLEKRLAYTEAEAVCMDEPIDWMKTEQALETEILRSKKFIEREILVPVCAESAERKADYA